MTDVSSAELGRDGQPRALSVSEIAQTAFVSLLRITPIPDEHLEVLNGVQTAFQIQQGDRSGIFRLTDYILRIGQSRGFVDIHANTDRGKEAFPLGFDMSGEPDFNITFLAEVPDAAGPL